MWIYFENSCFYWTVYVYSQVHFPSDMWKLWKLNMWQCNTQRNKLSVHTVPYHRYDLQIHVSSVVKLFFFCASAAVFYEVFSVSVCCACFVMLLVINSRWGTERGQNWQQKWIRTSHANEIMKNSTVLTAAIMNINRQKATGRKSIRHPFQEEVFSCHHR